MILGGVFLWILLLDTPLAYNLFFSPPLRREKQGNGLESQYSNLELLRKEEG